jgi:hypothetical protein
MRRLDRHRLCPTTRYNPYAVLYHLEAQSRGDDKNPSEIRYMMAHWHTYIDQDPATIRISPAATPISALRRIRTRTATSSIGSIVSNAT